MWEEDVRVPLLLRNIRRLGQARSTDALVEFIDLAPTILELLGVPPMASAQGRSLVPLLDGEENRHRDYVFSALLIDNKAMVRSERWKYIFATGARPLAKGLSTGLAPPGITHRLYDLEGDPRKTTNLADDPAHAAVLDELKRTILGRFEASHPNADAVPPGLSLDETLACFCEPTDPRPSAKPN